MTDKSVTRNSLLAAAREEFAAYGIAGARVDRIAANAGVSKERIYGHFGSKDKLFEAALAEAQAEYQTKFGSPGDDPLEYVGRIYDVHHSHPQLLRLLLWEALHHGDEALPEADARIANYQDKISKFAASLGIPADRRAAMLFVSLIGLAAWTAAVPQTTQLMLAAMPEAGEPDMRDMVLELAAGILDRERAT
ncbi:TetR/AcrR family transcriptional regulator [Pseudonocardiaceae bacterium YIM PH 21723]|nr:TetR/AcrR family transcriptional regulator [Pseudonocardiaceae bacterium YIM PH 21723]